MIIIPDGIVFQNNFRQPTEDGPRSGLWNWVGFFSYFEEYNKQVLLFETNIYKVLSLDWFSTGHSHIRLVLHKNIGQQGQKSIWINKIKINLIWLGQTLEFLNWRIYGKVFFNDKKHRCFWFGILSDSIDASINFLAR